MILQSKCNPELKKTLNYEYIEEQECCTECYTELHYYVTRSDICEEISQD